MLHTQLDIDKCINHTMSLDDDFTLLLDKISGKNINYIYLKQQKYMPIWKLQQALHERIKNNLIPDTVLFLEHEHVYTLGKNADEDFLLNNRPNDAEVVKTDRGGQVTYHGPGQLVGYPIMNLNHYKKSVSWFMRTLEQVIIETLKEFNISGVRQDGLPGVWVEEDKICAMGVRISRWVTMHGFALNVNPDMSYFDGMIPCGILDHGVTSVKEQLDKEISNAMIISVLMRKFNKMFKQNI